MVRQLESQKPYTIVFIPLLDKAFELIDIHNATISLHFHFDAYSAVRARSQ